MRRLPAKIAQEPISLEMPIGEEEDSHLELAVGKILDHLGLCSPEVAKPPPPGREVLRVAEHGDGWSVPAEWE
jgi:hypothetical protein